jgi:hypothetical protein
MGIFGLVLLGIGFYLIFCPVDKLIRPIKKFLNIQSPSVQIGDEVKHINDMTYIEFTAYIYSNGIHPVISYDDFEIYYIDCHYYYYYTGFDKDEFYEVEEIAALDYSCVDDLLLPDATILSTLFECDVCGEMVTDDRISYGWYRKVGDR